MPVSIAMRRGSAAAWRTLQNANCQLQIVNCPRLHAAIFARR
jgi:hypothetical protein